MAKTHLQELQEKRLSLQLRLDEVEAKIDFHKSHPTPHYTGLFLDADYKDPEVVSMEKEKMVLTKQLERIEQEITSAGLKNISKKKTRPKQETIYKAIEAMIKKNKNIAKEKCFELYSDKTGDSEEAIRKAYYAEQKKRLSKTSGAVSSGDSKAISNKEDGVK